MLKRTVLFTSAIFLFFQTVATAKTYEVSDSDKISLSALSIVKQNDWAGQIVAGNLEEIFAQIQTGLHSRDFLELKTILEREKDVLKFVADTSLFQKRTKIMFSLELIIDKGRPIIVVSDLHVFENLKSEWCDKAFIYMYPAQHKVMGSIGKAFCSQRSSIIYPIFESGVKDGVMVVDGDISLNGDSMYVDLFKLALAIYKNADAH